MSGGFLERVTPGQPFRPKASEWNTLLDTARIVQGQRVVVGQANELPPDGLRLMIALQDFTSSGDINGPGSSGQRDYSRGWCAELAFDPKVLDGSALRYLRVDGWVTDVWAPIGRSATDLVGGCGDLTIRCGDRFWARYGRSGKWEAVSVLPNSPTTTDCGCIKWGYALWEVVDGAWSLVANRCSGCYDAGTESAPFIFPQHRFLALGINDTWLREPSIDPASVTNPEGKYYVTCCSPTEPPPPPDDCACCYLATFQFEVENDSGADQDPVTVSISAAMLPTTTSAPCIFVSQTITISPGLTVMVSANAGHLILTINVPPTSPGGNGWAIVAQYDIAGDAPDCLVSATYDFSSFYAFQSTGGGSGFGGTSNTHTDTGNGLAFTLPTGITIDPHETCTDYAGGGGSGGGGGGACVGVCYYVSVETSPGHFQWQLDLSKGGGTGRDAECGACTTCVDLNLIALPTYAGQVTYYPCQPA